MRDTSLLAYDELRASGRQMTQAQQIYRLLNNSGSAMSLREIARRLRLDTSSVSGRVNDLKKDGLVLEVERRKCSISGKTIIPVTTA